MPGARIALEDELITSTKAIVYRGTAYYSSIEEGEVIDRGGSMYVVKFAWHLIRGNGTVADLAGRHTFENDDLSS